MENPRLQGLLAQLIAVAQHEFGEPEYKYYRVTHHWRCGRKRGERGSHYTIIGRDHPECSKSEYDQNVEEGKRLEGLAFLGKYNRSFCTWKRELVRNGWPQRLVTLIQNVAEKGGDQ
jgi:hypothetical protein